MFEICLFTCLNKTAEDITCIREANSKNNK